MKKKKKSNPKIGWLDIACGLLDKAATGCGKRLPWSLRNSEAPLGSFSAHKFRVLVLVPGGDKRVGLSM